MYMHYADVYVYVTIYGYVCNFVNVYEVYVYVHVCVCIYVCVNVVAGLHRCLRQLPRRVQCPDSALTMPKDSAQYKFPIETSTCTPQKKNIILN